MSSKISYFKVVFLGGAFLGQNRDSILENSKGLVQNAADSLQHKYLRGFVEQENVLSVDVVNLPFIFTYPRGYKNKFYKPVESKGIDNQVSFHEFGFINLPFFRILSRFYGAFVGSFLTLRKINTKSANNTIFFCYSMHFPFLLSSYLMKFFFKKTLFGLIVPDLPEFMSERKGLKKFFYSILDRLSYKLTSSFDFVIPITSQMGEVFKNRKHFVIEGMSDYRCNFFNSSETISDLPNNFILYTGTLDIRYGVADLLEAFQNADANGLSLVLCGSGDYQAEIIEISNKNKNIFFLGQVRRETILYLQEKSTLLVNPRNNSSEYTRFSFPSKIMEYMSSGTPVLMYRLDGIPDYYYKYCYVVDEFGGLAEAITAVSSLLKYGSNNLSLQAKMFISNEKNPKVMVSSLLKFINEEFYVQE